MDGARKKIWEKASASRFNSSLRELVDANYHSLESRDPADIQLFLVLFQPLRRTAISSLLCLVRHLHSTACWHPPTPAASVLLLLLLLSNSLSLPSYHATQAGRFSLFRDLLLLLLARSEGKKTLLEDGKARASGA